MILKTFQINTVEDFPKSKEYYIVLKNIGIVFAWKPKKSESIYWLIPGSDSLYNSAEDPLNWPLTAILPDSENGFNSNYSN